MSADKLALALAAFFTFGCISIYEARQHAKAMTPPLVLGAVCLGLFVALVAMAERPVANSSPMTRGQTMQKQHSTLNVD